MCGILAIVNGKRKLVSNSLIQSSDIIRHRGPDDEGFLTWLSGDMPRIWAGKDTSSDTSAFWRYENLPANEDFFVGFGHRRLSILDLSPAGHQPMLYEPAHLAITYNGEVYNYLEVKAELESLGHSFKTKSDTEVILQAWAQWGPKCLDKFNGMFAFVMLDYQKKALYAVRDRFGVKPLYYRDAGDYIVFSSEIKQIRAFKDYTADLNGNIVRQFFASGAVDQSEETFDVQIKQLRGGHYIHVDLSGNEPTSSIHQWYALKPKVWEGNFDTAAEELRNLLTDSVKLRLRSDVTVGSCLSGGLDSSSIVCIAADLLRKQGDFAGQETVTACYDNARYDEWGFAQEVIKKTNAHPHRTFPSFSQLKNEVESFLWHQDEPTGSTSQFSQWAVFKATHEAGLKVMIDGQGADEQLAGYGGNDLPYYTGLLHKAHLYSLYDEARNYKKNNGTFPYGFLLGALQIRFGKIVENVLPQRLRISKPSNIAWLNYNGNANLYNTHAHSLQQNLLRQVFHEPLPALLRYEDRNSMAWSVESRTPFMDYRLLEFTLGLPERYVYRHGVRKYILRKAMHNILPPAIENRKDKMGFVTPEELWLKGEGKDWFMERIAFACRQFKEFITVDALNGYVGDIISGKEEFTFVPWRIAAFGIWYESVMSNRKSILV